MSKEENTQTAVTIDDEQQQRKKERVRGIVTMLLWIVIFIGAQSGLSYLFWVFMEVDRTDPENVFNIMQEYMPLLLVLIVLFIRYFKTLKEDLKRLTKKNVIFIIIMAIIVVAIVRTLGPILDFFGVAFTNEEGMAEEVVAHVIPMTFTTALCAPIVEELVFRKALNQIVTNSIIFVLLAALIFGLLHAQNLSAIAYAIPGALLAITYLKTNKNVVASIIVHVINNSVGAGLMLLTL